MAIPFLNNINLNDNELQNVKLHLTQTSPSDNQGQFYLDSDNNKFRVYTTGWKNVAFEDWVTSNYPGTVTSVGLSMPSAFTVGNSPITSSGTIGVTGAGTSAQYIDGTGALQTFPTGIMFNFTVAGDLGTNQTITNTNTLTISGGTAIVTTGVNTDEIEVKHDTVSRTNNTSTAAPVNGGTFTAIDSITSSVEGHITAVNTKTVTLPSFNLSLAAVSSNATVLTLDASSGDDDTVTFEGTTNEIEITTPATGDAGKVKIGLPDNVTITNDLTVGGDINVTGSLNSYTTSELLVQDQYITLNSGQTSGVLDAFVKVERGTTDVALKWNEGESRWQFTNDGSTYYNIPIASEYDNFNFNVRVGSTSQEVADGGTVTFAAGNNGLTVAIGGDDTITYSHADTSSQASVDNSGLTVIQDVTLDTYGHVTGLSSANLTSGIDGRITARQYSATITDTDTVTHNLGTRDVIVQLYDVTTYETVYADVERTSTNAIDVTFASTPTNSIRVLVQKIG